MLGARGSGGEAVEYECECECDGMRPDQEPVPVSSPRSRAVGQAVVLALVLSPEGGTRTRGGVAGSVGRSVGRGGGARRGQWGTCPRIVGGRGEREGGGRVRVRVRVRWDAPGPGTCPRIESPVSCGWSGCRTRTRTQPGGRYSYSRGGGRFCRAVGWSGGGGAAGTMGNLSPYCWGPGGAGGRRSSTSASTMGWDAPGAGTCPRIVGGGFLPGDEGAWVGVRGPWGPWGPWGWGGRGPGGHRVGCGGWREASRRIHRRVAGEPGRRR